jgi:hypothetical protein
MVITPDIAAIAIIAEPQMLATFNIKNVVGTIINAYVNNIQGHSGPT